MQFRKVQSVGNHFPLIEAQKNLDYPSLSVAMCRSRFGVGGDGLLVVERDPSGVSLRMFNPDGTEDFCGNGIRCAALYAKQVGWAGDRFSVLHGGQTVPVEIDIDGLIRSRIGPASYEPSRVPHTGSELFNATVWSGIDADTPLSIFGSALTTGSTHVVIPIVTLPDDDTFRSVSAKIEADSLFPQRTSVIWAQEVAPMHLAIRIWERGVGETFGCGTGSSAAAADYLRRKRMGGAVRVTNPGGQLTVSAESWDQPLTISGRATIVFEGRI